MSRPAHHRLLLATAAAVVVAGAAAGVILAVTGAGSAGSTAQRTPPGRLGTGAGAAPADPGASPATVAGPAGRPVAAGFAPVSVTFVSPAEGWVLGSVPCPAAECTRIARTTDGGARWSDVPAPIAPLAPSGLSSGPAVGQLVFANPSDGWAYGPALYATHDGGATWRRLDLPNSATAITAMAASGGSVFAVAATDNGSGPPVLLRGADSGDTLSQMGTAPASSTPVLAAAGGRAWVLAGDTLDTMTTAGAQATSLPDPCPASPGGGAVSAWSAEQVAVACATSGAAGSQSKRVLVSTDGGVRFTAATAAPPTAGDLEAVATDGRTVVVGASSGSTEIYATFDGGRSWHQPYTDDSGGAPLSDLAFTTPSQLVAIEGVPGTGPQPFLVMSDDGGRTWWKAAING